MTDQLVWDFFLVMMVKLVTQSVALATLGKREMRRQNWSWTIASDKTTSVCLWCANEWMTALGRRAAKEISSREILEGLPAVRPILKLWTFSSERSVLGFEEDKFKRKRESWLGGCFGCEEEAELSSGPPRPPLDPTVPVVGLSPTRWSTTWPSTRRTWEQPSRPPTSWTGETWSLSTCQEKERLRGRVVVDSLTLRTLILRRGGSDSDPEDSPSSVIGRPSTFSDLEITNFCNDIQYIGILQLVLKRQSQEMWKTPWLFSFLEEMFTWPVGICFNQERVVKLTGYLRLDITRSPSLVFICDHLWHPPQKSGRLVH